MQKKNTTILDDLDSADKAATPGPWPCYSDADIADQISIDGIIRPALPSSDCELIALMRNNIRALLDVAKAAENMMEAHADHNISMVRACNILEEALSKLNRGSDDSISNAKPTHS